MSRIRVVVFDVGETLVDETRHWGEWADWLCVPRLSFFAALGTVIERGWHHRRVFELVRPGLDVEAEQRRRIEAGWTHRFEPGDFYPDALPCLAALRAAGFRVGLAGNQPETAEAALAAAEAPADFIASSARWGVEKPDPDFFAQVVAAAGAPPGAIAYVGDRLDNDVLPAKAAGMLAVFLRRGPWGLAHAGRAEVAQADLRLESLDGLAGRLAAIEA
ncbi:MAG TPA: HAD family hydrolase [Caulobacteraceae bacterium]|nr:HAD family hydrolase [Caulobacteraceae bacterium]